MAIGTHSQLKAAIQTWFVRDMSSEIADIITLTEAEIRKDVRCQAMETLATGTLTGETLAFPTGFVWAKRLKVGRYIKEYVTQADYADFDAQDSQTDVFTIIGQDIYILDGASGDDYSLIYFKAFTAFSDDGDTNWLLTNHPDVYLWGGCRQAAILTKDVEEFQRFSGLYASAVSRVNRNEWMASASGATPQVRSSARVF